jgi:small subunit ribosomal protein S6
MTLPAPTYDLILLLDVQAEEATRAKIVADARAAIEAQGELLRHDEWGERALVYPIQRRASAEYHLLQFHAGSAELLAELKRSLRIADGILRFRIIKLKPGVPEAPDMRAAATAARRAEPEGRAEPESRAEPEHPVEPEPNARPEDETAPAPAGVGGAA